MVTECKFTELKDREEKKYGLRTGHTYALLDTVDVKDGDNDVTLVKLRNPYGKDEYTGAWNRDDPKWTDENKELAELDKAKYGIFFIPMDVYMECFATYTVNMYDDNWFTSRNTIYTKGMTAAEKT